MRVGERHRTIACLLGLLFWFLFTPHSIHAEQLPIKTYTTSDGLVRDNVNRIVRDSHGFLWFCTDEGLSRFDGYQFTNYTTNQGLPHCRVSDLLETRDGSYWLATGDGICRFNPMSAPLFHTYHLGQNDSSRQVEVMVEDNAGVIWCGTHGGLYRLEAGVGNAHFQSVDMGMPVEGGGNVVHSIVADRQGALWVGTEGSGLYRRLPDGRAEHYSIQNELPDNRVEAMLEDHSGRLWV